MIGPWTGAAAAIPITNPCSISRPDLPLELKV